MTIVVRYDDNHLLAVVKPVGVPSQADANGQEDMLSAVKSYIAQRYHKSGAAYAGLVHRLDQPVGGLMLFARTSKAAARLSEQIRNGQWQKTYLAVTDGVPREKSAVLHDALLKNARTNTVRVVASGADGAKEAALRYDVVGEAGGRALLAVALYTGRPHQIRVQLAHMGFPVAGDHKYGRAGGLASPALWSWRLALEHPVRHENLHLEAPLPQGAPWDEFWRDNVTRAVLEALPWA